MKDDNIYAESAKVTQVDMPNIVMKGKLMQNDGSKNKFYKIPKWVKDLDDLSEYLDLRGDEFNCLKAIYGIAKARQGTSRHSSTGIKEIVINYSIIHKEFKKGYILMKMIQDLGMIQKKNKRERYAIYECTECKEPFKKRCSDAKYFNTQKCPKCNRGKHKQSKTRIYYIWGNMKKRCNNKEYYRFKEWGGRGIKLCKEWEDFANFYKWANENGYSDELTIDRKDNDKDLS